MKVVSWRCALNYLHVRVPDLTFQPHPELTLKNSRIVIAELEKSLDSAWTVFRALSIHTVRQKKSDSRVHVPFWLRGSYVVVNNYLSSIGEVSELSFPTGQAVWVCDWVTVVEAQNSVLGKVGVINTKPVMVFRLDDVEEGNIRRLFWVLLIVNKGMSMRKCGSLDIFSA